MNRKLHYLRFFPALFLLLLYSCGTAKHSRSEIELAMKRYDHFIQVQDADSISLVYTPDGNLGGIATGRDSIRNFLASFKNVRVLSQLSNTVSVEIKKDTAWQKGNYTQTDLISGKDTILVKGEYSARWQWAGKEGWLLKQMSTKPSK